MQSELQEAKGEVSKREEEKRKTRKEIMERQKQNEEV